MIGSFSDHQPDNGNADRNAWFLKVNGREMTYEDVIASWGPGCGPTGQSILARQRSPTARSEDDGVL